MASSKAPCSSNYSILEGVEKVFAKIQQGQERYQRRARNRAGKRKRDEESENDDESVRNDPGQS